MEQLRLFDFLPDVQENLKSIKEKISDGKGLNVLSLFNGISCGRLALERAGIKVDRYVSYEVDKYANAISQKNYPDDEYNGDVTTSDFTQYKGFDLVIGGSPCTYWSIAKTNREVSPDGIGGQLFMHFVRAIKETECKYFLYENNYSIHKNIKAFISEQLGVEPVMINSALVSAQSRKRCYWTNIPNVTQPIDREIMLKDILISSDRDKSRCVISSIGRTTTREYFKKQQGQMAVEPVCLQKQVFGRVCQQDGTYDRRFEAKTDNKSPTITSTEGRRFLAEPVIFSRPHGFNRGGIIERKSPTVTSTGSWVHNNHVIDAYAIPVEFDGNIPIKAKSIADGKVYPVYNVENGLIEIKDKTYPIKLKDGYYIIRKLTPIECERLQTLPDNYTEGVSNSQRYKCIGNGWTVEVIAHILKGLRGLKKEK